MRRDGVALSRTPDEAEFEERKRHAAHIEHRHREQQWGESLEKQVADCGAPHIGMSKLRWRLSSLRHVTHRPEKWKFVLSLRRVTHQNVKVVLADGLPWYYARRAGTWS